MRKDSLSDRYSLTYKFSRFDTPLNGARGLYFFNIVRWQITSFPLKFQKRELFSLPLIDEKERLKTDKDFFCLLGHGTILFQINGVRILTDPVFGDIPFYKRYTPFPYKVEDLGKIDVVLISHNHYDHMDLPSLRKIKGLEKIILPLKSRRYVKNIFSEEKIVELEWFEEFIFKGVKIVFLPAKHWSKRGIFDMNTSLWGSFLIKGESVNCYYAGDTAYSFHFKDLGGMFEVDYAFLPVGAYKPDYIMKHNHMTPFEAYQAFKDLKARHFIPVHYGVFKLSDEPVSEPLKLLKNFMAEETIPKVGQVINF